MMTDTDRHRIRDCFDLAQNSPDPSTKVGAKLYSDSWPLWTSCIAHAWNSFPDSSKVGPEYYDVRELKYDRMIHAEMRCLMLVGREAKGSLLYTSMIPCKDCAKHIAEARVRRVCYPESCLHSDFVKRQAESVHVGQLILAECDVEVVEVPGV